jgi:hypothetical protein
MNSNGANLFFAALIFGNTQRHKAILALDAENTSRSDKFALNHLFDVPAINSRVITGQMAKK